MRCAFEWGTLLRAVAILGVMVCAGSLAAQGPPMSGYTNSPYTTGTGSSDYIQSIVIRRGTTTLLSNLNSGPSASPYNTFYGAITPAQLIPSQQHQIDITVCPSWGQGNTAWIDYNNDGDFADPGEEIGFTPNIAANSTGTLTFTPPAGAGGLRRLRIRCVYAQGGPHGVTTSYTYGEAEDYLVNLGFAVSTTSLPNAAEGQPYNVAIQATNGTLSYIWDTNVANLPNGIIASQVGDDLVLSGTPTSSPPTAGSYPISVSVQDSSTPQKTATAQFTLYVSPPPALMPFVDDFSTDTGWLLGTGWQRGSATAFTGNTSVGPTRTEPGQDATPAPSNDNNILGHMIGADYTNNMSITYATSPPISCASATTVHVRFYRWLGVASGDWAKIQVTNNGNTWTDVYTNNGTASVNTPNQWESIAYDISAVAAGNAVVQVRFQMGTSDGNIVNVGWCIDDFQVLDPGPPLEVAEVGGSVITDNEPVGGLRDWGIVNTGTNTSVLTISFTNNGITPITFGSYSKTGNNPAQFYVIKQITTNPLPVGVTDTMEIQFNSPNAGVHTCTVNVPHNVSSGAGTSPFEINLRAEAVVPIPDLEVRENSATGNPITHNQSATGTIRDFGSRDIAAGPSTAITLTIVNAGTGSMSLNTPDMGGTWWNQYVVTVPGTFPSVLGPGANASFEVAFDPSSAGVKDAFVRISHSDSSKPVPYQIPVTGIGTTTGVPVFDASDAGGPLAHNDPASGPRDFGNVQVGTTAGPITITIANSGGVDLTLGTPTLGGPNPGEFALDLLSGPFASPVATGSNTSFDVTFTPTSVGQKDATISITHNDGSVATPFIINVTGNGVTTSPTASVHISNAGGPQLTNPAAATGALDFGVQDITAGPTAPVTIYVENTGTAPLTVAAPTLAGTNPTEFQLQNAGSFAQTLAIGASATFDIVFDPANVGTHTAEVRFTHNDAATGSPFVINVAGQAVLNAPLVTVRTGSLSGPSVASGNPATIGGPRDLGSINVTAGASAPLTIVIINQGTLDLNLGTPALAGANATSFVLNTAGFNAVVPPGDSTGFQVTFDPSLGGYKDAQIEFTHDDPTAPSPFAVPIRGTAVDPSGVQITTGSLPPSLSGEPYPALQVQAIQGATPYNWSIYDGNLPAGLNLSTTGVLDGTPTGFGGSFKVTLRVTDANGATHERPYSLIITSELTGTGRAKSSGCAAEPGSDGTLWLVVLLATVFGVVGYRRRRNA